MSYTALLKCYRICEEEVEIRVHREQTGLCCSLNMESARIVGICIGAVLFIPGLAWLGLRLLLVRLRLFQVKTRTVPPDCLLDPQYGRHHYVKINGVRLHYVEAGVDTEEDNRKPVMLFCHGFPEFWFVWRHQIKYFKNNFRVIAIDNRGYGESEKPRELEKYHVKVRGQSVSVSVEITTKLQELADDIKGLVESLAITKFTLVGHDWGGAVCWTFASLYPHLLSNLILCNCPHLIALR